jgi:hypothetical protein
MKTAAYHRAEGADQLSSPTADSTSQASASLTACKAAEPIAMPALGKARAGGHRVTRRTIMNVLVSSAIAGATTISPINSLDPFEQIKEVANGRATELRIAKSTDPVDPILAAIEAHKQAYDAHSASFEDQSELEKVLPAELRRSEYDQDIDGVKVVDADDPRWISHEIRKEKLCRAERECELQLVNVVPTTLEGIVALLAYCSSMEEKGHSWPSTLVDEDYDEDAPLKDQIKKTHSWHYYLHANIEECLRSLANAAIASKAIVPTKRVGPLERGGKLTRAGLLTRYQSFLVQELETVSWNLYGARDFAKDVIFADHEVSSRCMTGNYPLFDESKLTVRAHAVLKSLKIDSRNALIRS